MSSDSFLNTSMELSKQEVNIYLAKILAPAGHLHPIAGVITGQEQVIFASTHTISAIEKRITGILYDISKEYDSKMKTVEESYKVMEKKKVKGKEIEVEVEKKRKIEKSLITKDFLIDKKRMIDDIFTEAPALYVQFMHDFSVAKDGRGRREFTGVTIAQKTGINPVEKEGGMKDKLQFWKKKNNLF